MNVKVFTQKSQNLKPIKNLQPNFNSRINHSCQKPKSPKMTFSTRVGKQSMVSYMECYSVLEENISNHNKL